ncbi:CoA-transferase family III [Periconia macrospinosa]|uniref:CoA-transferase family III n=1 Tax=Periconia macrospinosa TaxID=97972 RepID=A0A2V1E4W1_9PLEO|nr:CoA-transferase family III [Periconia macrospinosa]
MDRQSFTPFDSVSYIWRGLRLPASALSALNLIEDGEFLPSSFKVDHLAQASIALSALTASLFYSTRNRCSVPKVTVPSEHACVEFKSERLYVLNAKPPSLPWGTIGGLHKCADGFVRVHDSFPHHRANVLRMLGLPDDAPREEVATKMLLWRAEELESEAVGYGAVIAALRSFKEWDAHPQSMAIADFPIDLRKLGDGSPCCPPVPSGVGNVKCLQGIRVVEMSRVIAAPVAGRTLAAHGADVIWVTSPTLPDLPDLDRDLARGKRTVQLDIKQEDDMAKLLELLRTADVFIQSYRPGSLSEQGLSIEELKNLNPNLIIANLSAYGPSGPWAQRRGFDSLVQTCSGLNVAEADRYGEGEPAHVLPCQALDHGAGYFLAAGIMAALHTRAIHGGSLEVNVSLAGVMRYLRSLGRYVDRTGYGRKDFATSVEVGNYLETRQSEFGALKAVKHSATIEGIGVGWDVMPKPLGSDLPVWLQ